MDSRVELLDLRIRNFKSIAWKYNLKGIQSSDDQNLTLMTKPQNMVGPWTTRIKLLATWRYEQLLREPKSIILSRCFAWYMYMVQYSVIIIIIKSFVYDYLCKCLYCLPSCFAYLYLCAVTPKLYRKFLDVYARSWRIHPSETVCFTILAHLTKLKRFEESDNRGRIFWTSTKCVD